MKLGAHMSTGGGVWRALERGISIDCEVVQLFVKNNMQWFGKPHGPSDLALYANQLATQKISHVFGHTGYLINLAAPASENRDKSIKSLIQELHFAAALGLPFLVMHPGAHLGSGEESGLRQAALGLNEVFRATKNLPLRIALENTAGQGSCLGSKNSDLAAIYEQVDQPKRLGVCLDTAHLFEAGFDIRTPRVWKSVLDEVDRLIGIDQVLALHLNDSKTDLGSHADRHAGIGLGKIGRDAFKHIVNEPRFKNVPGCLETPKSADLHEDVENLKILRDLQKG
jgi:deoxyribonuclease-4